MKNGSSAPIFCMMVMDTEGGDDVEERIVTMPVTALRGLTVLPGMTIHFDVSRENL